MGAFSINGRVEMEVPARGLRNDTRDAVAQAAAGMIEPASGGPVSRIF
jgi:hypothetical protein